MPAATFQPVRTTASFRHVDGGYFENSGVEAALFVIEELEAARARSPLGLDRNPAPPATAAASDHPLFRLLVLSESPPPQSSWASEGLGELMSPPRAMFRARVQRGLLAVSRAKSQRHFMVYLDHELFKMPLGWLLSARTADQIGLQIGTPGRCIAGERGGRLIDALFNFEYPLRPNEATAGLINESIDRLLGNWCAQCSLLQLVRGDAGDLSADHPCGSP